MDNIPLPWKKFPNNRGAPNLRGPRKYCYATASCPSFIISKPGLVTMGQFEKCVNILKKTEMSPKPPLCDSLPSCNRGKFRLEYFTAMRVLTRTRCCVSRRGGKILCFFKKKKKKKNLSKHLLARFFFFFNNLKNPGRKNGKEIIFNFFFRVLL